VVISYNHGLKKADVEFFPDGDRLLALHTPGQQTIVEVTGEPIEVVARRLRDWLRA